MLKQRYIQGKNTVGTTYDGFMVAHKVPQPRPQHEQLDLLRAKFQHFLLKAQSVSVLKNTAREHSPSG